MCFLKSVLKLSWHLYSTYSLICHCYQSFSCFPFFMTQQTPVLKGFLSETISYSCKLMFRISENQPCILLATFLIAFDFSKHQNMPFILSPKYFSFNVFITVWFISFLEAQNYFQELSPASQFIAATLRSVCMWRWGEASKMIAVAV